MGRRSEGGGARLHGDETSAWAGQARGRWVVRVATAATGLARMAAGPGRMTGRDTHPARARDDNGGDGNVPQQAGQLTQEGRDGARTDNRRGTQLTYIRADDNLQSRYDMGGASWDHKTGVQGIRGRGGGCQRPDRARTTWCGGKAGQAPPRLGRFWGTRGADADGCTGSDRQRAHQECVRGGKTVLGGSTLEQTTMGGARTRLERATGTTGGRMKTRRAGGTRAAGLGTRRWTRMAVGNDGDIGGRWARQPTPSSTNTPEAVVSGPGAAQHRAQAVVTCGRRS